MAHCISCATRLRARRRHHSRRGERRTHFFFGAAFFLAAFCFFGAAFFLAASCFSGAAFFAVCQRPPHPESGSGDSFDHRDLPSPRDIWTPNRGSGLKRLEGGRSPSASSAASLPPACATGRRSPPPYAPSGQLSPPSVSAVHRPHPESSSGGSAIQL